MVEDLNCLSQKWSFSCKIGGERAARTDGLPDEVVRGVFEVGGHFCCDEMNWIVEKQEIVNIQTVCVG